MSLRPRPVWRAAIVALAVVVVMVEAVAEQPADVEFVEEDARSRHAIASSGSASVSIRIIVIGIGSRPDGRYEQIVANLKGR